MSMSFQHGVLKRVTCLQISSARRWKTRFAYPEGMVAYEEDYTNTPDYPPINPELRVLSDKRREKLENKLTWRETLKRLPTVEEKNLHLNSIRRYGWNSHIVDDTNFEYGSLPFFKHITRTHVAANDSLPQLYSSPELMEKVNYFKEKVRGPLLDALKFEKDVIMRDSEMLERKEYHERIRATTSSIVSQINRVLLNILGQEVNYLNTCSVDENPNVHAFWMVGGMEPPLKTRKSRERFIKWCKRTNNDPKLDVDQPEEGNIQYFGCPLLQVRCDNSIKSIVEADSSLVSKGEEVTNRFKHVASHFGILKKFKFASIIPGHWSGDKQRSCHVSFHSSNYLSWPYRSGEIWNAEKENSLQSQATLVSFSRLLSEAFFLGFDQFSDLNYPISTQTVITDGLQWSFFAYQLNTLKLDGLNIEKNNKQNLCWGTKRMNIFDDQSPDKLNDTVLENLLKFYLNPMSAVSQSAADLSPYVKAELTNFEDEKVRAVLFHNYREQLIQKQDRGGSYLHRQFPEIYEWERIFKILHKMRPLDARKRFFELPKGFKGSDPYNEPYVFRNPMFAGKGLRKLRELYEEKSEKERIEATRLAEKSKYAKVD